MKLYVTNLSSSVTEIELQDIFSNLGHVSSVKIVIDPSTGLSKGFGYVEMPNDREATTAINEINGTMVKGRSLSVQPAKGKDRV